MIISRKEAIRLMAFIEIFRLPLGKRNFIIETALLENGIENASEAKKYFYLRNYIEYELKFVQNSYLEKLISDRFNENVTVDGKQPHLNKCPCCDYKTLKERGHYEICPVCYWEDDGAELDEDYSGPNHITLREGKRNFQEYGTSDKRSAETIDEERMLKYSK